MYTIRTIRTIRTIVYIAVYVLYRSICFKYDILFNVTMREKTQNIKLLEITMFIQFLKYISRFSISNN